MSNTFNGNYLSYNITTGFYHLIKKLIHPKEGKIFLYNNEDIHMEINNNNVSTNNPFYLPIGLFNNKKFTSYYKIIDNNRSYEYPIKNHYNKDIISLTKLQKSIYERLNNYIEEISTNKNYIIPIHLTLNLPCGFGKTVIATYFSLQRGLKTLVIVNRKILMEQWAKHFILSGCKVLTSYQGSSNLWKRIIDQDFILSQDEGKSLVSYLEDIDILIIPDKHLANRDLCKHLANNFSICYIDESHKYNLINKSHLNYFLTHYFFKYLISLSGTPNNNNVLFFGHEISLSENELREYINERRLIKNIYIVDKYCKISIPSNLEITRLLKKIPNLKSLNSHMNNIRDTATKLLMHDNVRNSLIVESILRNTNDDTRGIVIFNLLDHIKIIYDRLTERSNLNIIVAEAGKVDRLIDNIRDCKNYIILATDSLLGTGFDMKNLNTLHLITLVNNRSDVIQLLGRLEREDVGLNRYLYIYIYNSYTDNNFTSYFNRKQNLVLNYTMDSWNKKILRY